MLAGGANMMAASVPALAHMPGTGLPELHAQRPDARLLNRIELAHDCLADYLWSRSESIGLHRTLSDDPDGGHWMPRTQAERERWNAVMERAGVLAADARCDRLYDQYEAALAAAFAEPARTVAGVYGKLRLAVKAVKQEQSAGFDTVSCVYLDSALGDLGRLAARYSDIGSPPP